MVPMMWLGVLFLGFPLLAQSGREPFEMASLVRPALSTGNLQYQPLPFRATPRIDLSDFEPEGQSHYRWSAVSLVAVGGMSAAGEGVTSVAIRSGVVGATLLIERALLKHHPQRNSRMAWLNVAVAGGLAASRFSTSSRVVSSPLTSSQR